MNPEYAEAYFYRAKLEIVSGDKENACKDLQKAYEMNYEEALELINSNCK